MQGGEGSPHRRSGAAGPTEDPEADRPPSHSPLNPTGIAIGKQLMIAESVVVTEARSRSPSPMSRLWVICGLPVKVPSRLSMNRMVNLETQSFGRGGRECLRPSRAGSVFASSARTGGTGSTSAIAEAATRIARPHQGGCDLRLYQSVGSARSISLRCEGRETHDRFPDKAGPRSSQIEPIGC